MLKELAATAEQRRASGDLAGARDAYQRALSLLPDDTRQHAAISAQVAALDGEITRPASPNRATTPKTGPWWKRGLGGIGAFLLVALSKLKFLLLGLTKLSTFVSMFAFFGVYWSVFGWPLALGLVVSIYIHEMGHVASLRHHGINAGAPVFIPGLGALVRLRQRVDDPVVDARIGLAGPVWGLGAGLAALVAARVTGSPTMYAIAQLTGYINLFNLIPVWQLDGSRGFHALDRTGRIIVVGVAGAMYAATSQPLLVLIAIVGAFRAYQKTDVRTNRVTLATFAMLLVTLALLAEIKTGVRLRS